MCLKKFWMMICFLGLSSAILGAASIENKPAPKVFVLCYHTFLGKAKIPTDFSIDELRSQIKFFQDNGFRFVQFKDVLNKRIQGSKNIIVVIDDGNISAQNAYESVLKPAGIKPVFAIYPAIINRVKYAMTWEQLKGAQKEGCEIMSHGFFHLYMREKFYNTKPKEFEKEIALSKQWLEEHLPIQITEFVYPFGVESESAKTRLKANGYRYAFGLTQKPMTLDNTQDPFDLPRYMLTRSAWKGILSTIQKQAI